MGAVDLAPKLSPGVIRLVDRIILKSGDPGAWEAAFYAVAPVESRWAFSLGTLARATPELAAGGRSLEGRARVLLEALRLAEHFEPFEPDPVRVAARRRACPALWKADLRRHLAIDGLWVPVHREPWT